MKLRVDVLEDGHVLYLYDDVAIRLTPLQGETLVNALELHTDRITLDELLAKYGRKYLFSASAGGRCS